MIVVPDNNKDNEDNAREGIGMNEGITKMLARRQQMG